MNRLQLAIEQIVFARNYTIGLLDQTPADDWFRLPAGGVSHVAWQVGHIAFAEYRLALWRIRDEQPGDVALFSPDFKRLFVFEGHATEVAEEQALQEFYRLGLHKTQGATGVLLFVSLLEHRVVVLGDAGIDAKVGAEHWQRTKDAFLGGIERGSLRDGLIDGVRQCGDVLGQHFPCAPGDKNEVEDRVIVRAE